MLLQAIAVAVALLLVAAKFKITTLRRMLAYHAAVDIAVTALLMVVLQGTFAGMVVAMVAGGILSIVLVIARKVIGYEKRVIKRCERGHLHTEWEEQAPMEWRPVNPIKWLYNCMYISTIWEWK